MKNRILIIITMIRKLVPQRLCCLELFLTFSTFSTIPCSMQLMHLCSDPWYMNVRLMSSIREIIGSGTWMGITIIPESVDRMTVMNSAPGGFFVFGCLMAGCVWLERKLNKPIERKSCGDVMLEKIDAAKEEQKEGAAQ